MIRRLHIPNLFWIVGQPDNGKTTISNWFEKMLGCEVIHTDQLYHEWIAANYPKQSKSALQNIRGHYPRMTGEWRREWNEYAAQYIMAAIKRAKMDLVVEGWLMFHMPDDLKKRIDQRATTMTVHMKHYYAHAAQKIIRPQGRDYTNSVQSLCNVMSRSKGISFMRRLAGYQSFEDIRDFQGISDSCGKLLALNLPANMLGKKVLDVGCSTGYFTIRCVQRGAKAVGIDRKRKCVRAATRIATAVYRTRKPQFCHCDFVNWDKQHKFDYILAINILSVMTTPNQIPRVQEFFDKAFELLVPGGTLVVEAAVRKYKKGDPEAKKPTYDYRLGQLHCPTARSQRTYPNEAAIIEAAKRYELTFKGSSVRMHGDKVRRVYHFTKPIVQA